MSHMSGTQTYFHRGPATVPSLVKDLTALPIAAVRKHQISIFDKSSCQRQEQAGIPCIVSRSEGQGRGLLGLAHGP